MEWKRTGRREAWRTVLDVAWVLGDVVCCFVLPLFRWLSDVTMKGSKMIQTVSTKKLSTVGLFEGLGIMIGQKRSNKSQPIPQVGPTDYGSFLRQSAASSEPAKAMVDHGPVGQVWQ